MADTAGILEVAQGGGDARRVVGRARLQVRRAASKILGVAPQTGDDVLVQGHPVALRAQTHLPVKRKGHAVDRERDAAVHDRCPVPPVVDVALALE